MIGAVMRAMYYMPWNEIKSVYRRNMANGQRALKCHRYCDYSWLLPPFLDIYRYISWWLSFPCFHLKQAQSFSSELSKGKE